ncbi:MAG: sulfotransferase [Bacteroidota bacterium]
MSLPNTFIIGIQKAGTTAFYDWLTQHPDVFGPEEVKDLHFFSLDQYFNQGIGLLEKIYKGYENQNVILNAGVNYINHGFALKRIRDFNPNVKLIVIFRDPVKRAYSAYNYFFKLGFEGLSFDQALEREKKKAFEDPVEQANFTYMDHGFYAEKLNTLFSIFPKEQIKFLVYEEVIKNKQEAVADIFKFLEIDNSFQCDFTTKNKTGQPLFRWVNKLVFGDNALKRFVKSVFRYDKLISLEKRNKIAQKLIKINTQSNKSNGLNEDKYNELRKHFESDINQLSEILNKDLNQIWKF